MRCSRLGPTPRVNTRPNSSFTYWVTRPLTDTSHCSPSTSMTRRGISGSALRKFLQPGLDVGHEPISVRAVDDAVIEGQRQHAPEANRDHIGSVDGDDSWLLVD